jgi:hypothetical protein
MYRAVAAFLILLGVTACGGPSALGERTFSQLSCGMTEDSVAALAGNAFQKQSGPSPDGTTHTIITQDWINRSTYIHLSMPSGSLTAARLCWDYKTMAVACANAPQLTCDDPQPNKSLDRTREG